MSFAVVAQLPPPGPPPTDSFLATELIGMMMTDQEVRMRVLHQFRTGLQPSQALLSEVRAIDRVHLKRLKLIIKQHGWPTIRLVGQEGEMAAFLIVQHADQEPEFQKRCLGIMGGHLESGEVNRQNYAYLWDRVAVNSGQKQRYGTQLEPGMGVLALKPVESPGGLDKRRKAMGLGTIAEYLELVKAAQSRLSKG